MADDELAKIRAQRMAQMQQQQQQQRPGGGQGVSCSLTCARLSLKLPSFAIININ